jgi:hypothetical protein
VSRNESSRRWTVSTLDYVSPDFVYRSLTWWVCVKKTTGKLG